MRSKLAYVPNNRDDRYRVEDSRSVQSGWVWRGFFMMSMLAVGITFIFLGNGKETLGILWGVIAVGWFAISMWLWRKHSQWMKQ